MRHFIPPYDPARGAGSRTHLSVESLSFTLWSRPILRDISLEVAEGETVALLGRDGAGKTTCIDAIAGRVPARAGRIVLNGVDVTRKPVEQRAKLGLGYLAEEVSVFSGLTVEENVLAALEVCEHEPSLRAARLEQLLAAFGLTSLRAQPAYRVSGGERRRCELARAMALDPSIMLLDQPFRGLDPESIRTTIAMIREIQARGVAVLISEYDVYDLVDLIDRAYVLDRGRVIFAGTRDEFLSDPLVREQFLGGGLGEEQRGDGVYLRRLLRRANEMANA